MAGNAAANELGVVCEAGTRPLVSVGSGIRPCSYKMLRVAPLARPAGFHQLAVASSATATKAPPIPCARVPTLSKICAPAGAAERTTHTRPAAERLKNEVRIRCLSKQGELKFETAGIPCSHAAAAVGPRLETRRRAISRPA